MQVGIAPLVAAAAKEVALKVLPGLLMHPDRETRINAKIDQSMFAPSGTMIQAYQDVNLLPKTATIPTGQTTVSPSVSQANVVTPTSAPVTANNVGTMFNNTSPTMLIAGAVGLVLLIAIMKKKGKR